MFRPVSCILLALSLIAGFVSVASAADAKSQPPKAMVQKIDCTLTTSFNSRPLFLNAGIYASKGAAQISDINCTRDELYFNLWNLTPYSNNFGDGGEFDVRFGWAKKYGPWGVDLSGAWYNFRINGLGTLNSANLRGKVSYDFLPANSAAILQAYGLLDYQHSFDFRPSEAFAVVGGAYVGYWVTPKLQVGVGAEVWQYLTTFAPNKTGTIYSVAPQVKYKLTDDVLLFGQAGFASGSLAAPGDHGWKHSLTGGVSVKFSAH